MAHFYESSIITTKDGVQCQVYSNEHPEGYTIVKPKYIPMDKISSDKLQCRYLTGKRVNRLNMWIDKKELKRYISEFKKNYPEYVYNSELHKNWFFAVPTNRIEKTYDPKKGLCELMQMPERGLDRHLRAVAEFVKLVLKSGLKTSELGVTYSTLVGHYVSDISDINLVVYGKENFWKLMMFLEKAEHPKLKWKTDREWLEFRKQRNRAEVFSEKEFLFQMKRKKSEGFFNNCLFVIFCVENPEETWFKWGDERYEPSGLVKIKGIVTGNYNSAVRPGVYEIKDAEVVDGKNHGIKNIKQVVYHSRDYIMQAYPGEKIEAAGLLEKAIPKKGEPYHRIVIGYFDAYISGRRGKEYIKVIENGKI